MAIYRTSTISVGGDIPQLGTVTDLRNYLPSGIADGDGVIVTGPIAPAQQNGGFYVWSSQSLAADDNYYVIKPTTVTNAGRWVKSFGSGPIGPVGPASSVPGPVGSQGSPGANTMAIGSFASARLGQLVIPTGTTTVMTSYHTVSGYGSAKYIINNSLTATQVANLPRSTFTAKDSSNNTNTWMLYSGGDWDFMAFGPIADNSTDCYPAYAEMDALNVALNVSGRKVTFPTGKFYSSQTWSLQGRWEFVGSGGGSAGAANTTITFAADNYGIISNRYNTNGIAVVANGASRPADGSTIRSMCIASKGGINPQMHGIWMRSRMTLEDVTVFNFPGNNIHIVASDGNGQTQPTTSNYAEGNANDWQLNRVTVYGSGQHGIFVQGADSNAGQGTSVEVLSAGGGGIVDLSFLGNNWTGWTVHGTGSKVIGQVNYLGTVYRFLSGYASDGATTPGTNKAVWYPAATTTAADTWSATGNYVFFGAVLCPGQNTRSVFTGGYVEVGQCGTSHVPSPSMVNGGNLQTEFTTNSSYEFGASGVGGFRSSYTGYGSYKNAPSSLSTAYGGYGYATLGEEMFNNGGVMTYQRIGCPASYDYRWNLLPGASGGIALNVANLYNVAQFTGNTAPAFGRALGDRFYAILNNGFVPNGSSGGRKVWQVLGGSPSAGIDYGTGEYAWTTTPYQDKASGFSCVAGATISGGQISTQAVWLKTGTLFADATATYDAPSLAVGTASPVQTVAVAAAELGDAVRVTYVGNGQGLKFDGWVSAAGTVSFYVQNPSGNPAGTVDLASGTYKVRVEKM